MWLLLITFGILLITLCVSKNWKYSHLPSPGYCLPIIGHVHKLMGEESKKDPIGSLWNLYKTCSKNGMLYLSSFNLKIIFVGDFETVKEIFNHPDFQDRMIPQLKSHNDEDRMNTSKETLGVIQSEGKIWTEQRRFALRTLRDFGFGKTGMEELVKEELNAFIEMIKKTEGEPFDFLNKFNLPILNALWRVTVGERFEYDNPRLISIVDRLGDTLHRLGKPENAITIAFPWIAKIFPSFMERNKNIEVSNDLIRLMKEKIKEHQDTIDPNDPRDFIDKVLIEIQNTVNPDSSFYGDLGISNLENTLFDLFLAGSETTSTTLTWAVLYMIRYPDVQTKVQQELDEIVGLERLPSVQDRAKLPYTEAVLMEIQRYANIVPNGVQHVSSRDITIRGVVIPANTMVNPLFTELLKGEYWGDGTTFRPERFLDECGNVKKDDHFIPFSIGRRQCLGETLAKTELFLFFCGLVQQFEFQSEVEGQLPTEEYNPGVTVLPLPFKARLKSRMEGEICSSNKQ